jgi:hypothetical protein
MWDFNNNTSIRGALNEIFKEPEIASRLKTDSDVFLAELVAQAVIQWLGCNNGRIFLGQAERLIEKHIELTANLMDPGRPERIKREKVLNEQLKEERRQSLIRAEAVRLVRANEESRKLTLSGVAQESRIIDID